MMDLLDLAQIENNSFKLNQNFFSVFDSIDQAFLIVGHIANTKKVKLVPPTILSEEGLVNMRNIFGDKNRMTQILVNLVSNSLKFSPTGSQIKLHLQIVNKDLDFDLSKMAINS